MEFLTAQNISGVGIFADMVGALGLLWKDPPMRVLNGDEESSFITWQRIWWGVVVVGFFLQLWGNFKA